ncbi:MAG: hypothetical protein K2N09_06720 [Muribaculaceae bacterium]|nr:hypothetical protein [Muribaculaceae bacterium]
MSLRTKNGIHYLLICLICNILLISCGNSEDEETIINNIIGSWYGTRTYYNPASGTKYQYLNITFESNGMGNLEYTAPSSHSYAKFNYKISGNKILCNGYYATDAYEMDSAEKFEMTLNIEGDRLIPLDRYSYFILTKDDSVMTDSNGNEVIDDSSMLNNVWVRTDGYSVCVIENEKCTEYTLLKQYGKIYSSKTIYDIHYDVARKIIRFGTTEYDIVILNSSTLEIKNNKNHFIFTLGSSKDIPSAGESGDDDDVKALLVSARFGWKTNENITRLFNFIKDGRAIYMEGSERSLGSIGRITLCADGSYTLKNRQITCQYTDVQWDYGDELTKDWFPGWTYNKARTRKYTIRSISSESLTLEDEDGKVYITSPV